MVKSKRFSEVLTKHVHSNLLVYFLVIMFFLIGISSGAFTTKALTEVESKELISYLENFFKVVDTKIIDRLSILKLSIINNLQTGILIWILGVTVIGIPVILLLVAFRGFIIGFTVGFLIKQKGIKGLIFSIFSIMPHNILIIPGIIVIAVLGISFSIMLIKNRVSKKRYDSIFNQFIIYSTLIAIVFIIISIGCFIEAYISPLFVKILSSYM